MQNITNVFMLHATSNLAEINVVKNAFIAQIFLAAHSASILQLNTLINFMKLDSCQIA